jgi:hypothetical protein
MLLATSRLNRHQNWDICYIGENVSVSALRRSLSPTFWPNAARLSSPHHRCWIVLPLKISETRRIFCFLEYSHSPGQADRQWLRTSNHIRPPVTEHPTPTSHHSITHSIYSVNFTNLPISFSRANMCGINKFVHWPYLTTGGFSIFILISRQND